MAGGVHFSKVKDLWLPPLSLIMVLPQLWDLFPAPIPTTVAPKGAGLRALSLAMMSPNMGGISPACHNKVYYENRLVWGQRERQIHLGCVAQVK